MTRPTRHRRKMIEDINNHDRWMVSYADFITLLFAFFVVMYSMSSVNEVKYKSLTHSLDSAFASKHKNKQGATLQPVQLDTAAQPMPLAPPPAVIFKPITLNNLTEIFKPVAPDNKTAKEIEQRWTLSEGLMNERKQLKQVSDQLKDALGPFIADHLISVKQNDYWISLEMNSELLFLSGEATLSKKATPVLKKIAQVINTLPNAINVEGHTDNKPIDTVKFPSNWDLSSARATSVVQELINEGINPTRLSAIGYGEFHPIGDNNVEEGRFKNRRVILVLMSQAFSRYGANDKERAELLNMVPTTASDDKPTSPPK